MRAFATTSWSLVRLAGNGDRVALNELCRRYHLPLLTAALYLTRDPERAGDLVQDFLVRFVDRNVVSKASPQRGRFRAFLRTSLRNFFYNVCDKENAWVNGGRATFVSIDDVELRDGRSAERDFNQSWARVLLDRTLSRIREEETRAGNGACFEALVDRLLEEDEDDAPLLHQTAAALGKNASTLRGYLRQLRRRHAMILRAEVADTVDRPEDVEQEISELLSAWDETT